jgi:molecular chaperone GrpE
MSKSQIKKREKDVEQFQVEVNALEEKWKRAMADYRNLEKRMQNQQQVYARHASLGLIDKLLPVLDDLERAALHISDPGLTMVIGQFHSVLESEDVTKIDAQGKEFNPNYMDCVEMVPGKKNMVMSIVQPGYMLNETVIRPAKVQVGDGSRQRNKK